VSSRAVVLFNHFFVSADAATFRSIEESSFIRRFAACEKRTTVRRDNTYTGLYLYGVRTYFEFLAPGSTMMGARSGIAFGVETDGDIDRVSDALRSTAEGRVEVTVVTRALPSGGETPWFRSCSSEPSLLRESSVADWVMEYQPEFFTRFHPDLPPSRATIARADALTRYAAASGQAREHAEALFEDVVGLELSLVPADLARLAQRGSALGLAVDRSASRVSCNADDFQLSAAATQERAIGVSAAHLRLRRDAGRSEHRIGSTLLSLDGKRAVWRF
jgi:hypothetical protein